MKKADMLLGGPGLDGYTYHADTYCVACGQAIIRSLPEKEYDDVAACDSDEMPQPIFFGEHPDRAVHCAECGDYMYGGDDG